MATNLAYDELRAAPRDEVHYRTRGTAADGRTLALLVVNISAMGMMARCEGTSFAVGDRLKVRLPVVGTIEAEVRWALGGRIGCELGRAIDLPAYYSLLAAMVKR
jgi:hypothetical protein